MSNKIDFSSLPKTILLIFGLPGSGKTTLATSLVKRILPGQYVYFNADKVRSTLSKDLGFSIEDRREQARRMGCVASLALDGSDARLAVVDFVNPNLDTWDAFKQNLGRPVGKPVKTDVNRVPRDALEDAAWPCVTVFMNTIQKEACEFADTAALFARGERPVDIEVTSKASEEDLNHNVQLILHLLNSRIQP